MRTYPNQQRATARQPNPTKPRLTIWPSHGSAISTSSPISRTTACPTISCSSLGDSTECGGGIDFSMHIRQMIFDVAFIQNISDKPISIDGLLGSEVPATGLRPAGSKASSAVGQIALSSGEIKPGETIAVPLAISFIMADSLKQPFENAAGAAKTFKAIQAAKPGTVFELKDEDADPPAVIRKTRESFGPPTTPKPALYAFGPELQLTGPGRRAAMSSFSIRPRVISCS